MTNLDIDKISDLQIGVFLWKLGTYTLRSARSFADVHKEFLKLLKDIAATQH